MFRVIQQALEKLSTGRWLTGLATATLFIIAVITSNVSNEDEWVMHIVIVAMTVGSVISVGFSMIRKAQTIIDEFFSFYIHCPIEILDRDIGRVRFAIDSTNNPENKTALKFCLRTLLRIEAERKI